MQKHPSLEALASGFMGSSVFRDLANATRGVSCPPVVENELAPTVTAPAGSGPRVGTRLSNLDRNDRLVKRGRKVSYHGLRGLVTRVRAGRCHVGYLDAFERFTGCSEWLVCESVQVVA